MSTVPRTAVLLGCAGLSPFLLAVVLVAVAGPGIASVVRPALALYALAILSFLSGAWWGIALLRRAPTMLIASNAVVVAAWASVLVLDAGIAMLILAGLFVTGIIVEGRYPVFAPQPAYYRRMRMWLTGVATVSLVLVATLH